MEIDADESQESQFELYQRLLAAASEASPASPPVQHQHRQLTAAAIRAAQHSDSDSERERSITLQSDEDCTSPRPVQPSAPQEVSPQHTMPPFMTATLKMVAPATMTSQQEQQQSTYSRTENSQRKPKERKAFAPKRFSSARLEYQRDIMAAHFAEIDKRKRRQSPTATQRQRSQDAQRKELLLRRGGHLDVDTIQLLGELNAVPSPSGVSHANTNTHAGGMDTELLERTSDAAMVDVPVDVHVDMQRERQAPSLPSRPSTTTATVVENQRSVLESPMVPKLSPQTHDLDARSSVQPPLLKAMPSPLRVLTATPQYTLTPQHGVSHSPHSPLQAHRAPTTKSNAAAVDQPKSSPSFLQAKAEELMVAYGMSPQSATRFAARPPMKTPPPFFVS